MPSSAAMVEIEPVGRIVTAIRVENLKDLWDAERGALPPALLFAPALPSGSPTLSLRRGGWRDCNLPRNASSIGYGYAGLKQLGNRSLIGLEQFIRRFSPSNRLLRCVDYFLRTGTAAFLIRPAALAASASFSKPNIAEYLRPTTCAITKLRLIPASPIAFARA